MKRVITWGFSILNIVYNICDSNMFENNVFDTNMFYSNMLHETAEF